MRVVPEVITFSKLPKDVQSHYDERAAQEMDYMYYRVHAVEKISAADAAVSSMDAERTENASSSSLPVETPSAQAVALERNAASYIKPGSAPYVLTLYHPHHQDIDVALAFQRNQKGTDHSVIRVSWINFIRNSFVLSEEDVRVSQCLHDPRAICSECQKVPNGRVKLEYCDGSPFPGRGPTAFPCNRLLVCPPCRIKTCYRKTDSWFCRICRETPATFVGIYGHAICPPRDSALCRDVSRNGLHVLPSARG